MLFADEKMITTFPTMDDVVDIRLIFTSVDELHDEA